MEDEGDDGEGIEEEDDVDVAGWTRRSLDRGRGRYDEGSTSMTARGVKVIAGRRGGDGPSRRDGHVFCLRSASAGGRSLARRESRVLRTGRVRSQKQFGPDDVAH